MPVLELAEISMPLSIGATGIAALEQNIRIICTTLAYSVAMDRGFAHVGAFVDAPTPYDVARLIADITEAIEAKEPRVAVERISLEPSADEAMQGRLYPRIVWHLREGVSL